MPFPSSFLYLLVYNAFCARRRLKMVKYSDLSSVMWLCWLIFSTPFHRQYRHKWKWKNPRSRREKQMGKFVTDNIVEDVWVVCGMMVKLSENTYTLYGKSLSFSSGWKKKWIFQMCYFICAIWHFFHPLWVIFLFCWLDGWLRWWFWWRLSF